jgi:hypothetical protein
MRQGSRVGSTRTGCTIAWPPPQTVTVTMAGRQAGRRRSTVRADSSTRTTQTPRYAGWEWASRTDQTLRMQMEELHAASEMHPTDTVHQP